MKRLLVVFLFIPVMTFAQLGGVHTTLGMHHDTLNARVGTAWVATVIPVENGQVAVQAMNDTTTGGPSLYISTDTTKAINYLPLVPGDYSPPFFINSGKKVYTRSSSGTIPRRVVWW